MRGWGAVLAAAALAGCGSSASDYMPRVSVLGTSDELEDKAPEAPVAIANAVKRPVADITGLELGRMVRGRLLTAHGIAPAGGWFQPELRPLNDGRPAPDGFLEFEFMAAPPDLNGGVGQPGLPVEQRLIRADRVIRDSADAVGVRVFSVKETPHALRFDSQPGG